MKEKKQVLYFCQFRLSGLSGKHNAMFMDGQGKTVFMSKKKCEKMSDPPQGVREALAAWPPPKQPSERGYI